jgi:hypothetical protein
MKKTEKITLQIGHVVEIEVTQLIEDVIQIAQQSRATGKTKAGAVRDIYPIIANLQREQIWYAIIHGVNISSRGAVTYYYNMIKEETKAARAKRG